MHVYVCVCVISAQDAYMHVHIIIIRPWWGYVYTRGMGLFGWEVAIAIAMHVLVCAYRRAHGDGEGWGRDDDHLLLPSSPSSPSSMENECAVERHAHGKRRRGMHPSLPITIITISRCASGSISGTTTRRQAKEEEGDEDANNEGMRRRRRTE